VPERLGVAVIGCGMALDDPRVGMALILTPPDARERWVAAATQRQLPVLMEKPIERTTEAAESLVALCEASARPERNLRVPHHGE